jgi:hypothetical protein
MMRGRYSKVLRVVGVGTAVLVSAIFSTGASASPLTAKQAVPRSGAAAVNLAPAATNCGDGVSYLPAGGQAMTAADYAALGMPVPPTGSALTRPRTRWVVPRCANLPAGQHPGEPAARSASTVSSQVGFRPAASTQMGASPNWTGFQSNGGGPYNDASTEWTIPSSFPTPPGDTYESSWAGIGSGASDSNGLFQAGTETNVNTSDGVSNYAWWEFYPENREQKITNFPIRSGSVDYAEVSHTGYGQGHVQVCTEPPGQSSFTCTSFGVAWGTPYTIGSSQFECIAERTEVNGTLPRLTNIAGVQFYNCKGYTSSWQAIGNLNRIYWYMAKTPTASQCRTAPWAAQTGSIYNSDDFAINWYGYGWPILAEDCSR